MNESSNTAQTAASATSPIPATHAGGPPAPACPSWCTRPELVHQGHRNEWDFVEDDGMSRNHTRAYGEHVVLTGVEYSRAPGVVEDLAVQVYVDEGAKLSYGDAIVLAARLVQATAELDKAGVRP
jgi:hypothetical protein